jgi:hypothetical protein
MRFIHLVHLDASNFDRMTMEERQDVDRRGLAQNAELAERGVLVHTEAVQDNSSAVLVRVRNGKISVTDGPYIESKEQMAGYVLIDVPTKEEAVKLAGENPMAEYGTVEVRPVYTF